MLFGIVTTTISPIFTFLEAYERNLKQFGAEKNVIIYIAGDRKSSPESIDISKDFCKKGIQVKYLDIYWQHDFLKRFSGLDEIIPENSDNRRNVGFLLALQDGADIIVSVDDDNYPIQNIDFIGEHANVGKVIKARETFSENRWFNLCSLLTPSRNDDYLFPRGFPYKRRIPNSSQINDKTSTGTIGINVGLWISDPDVDAIARLYSHPKITSWSNESVILGKKDFTPINTQNTALSREAMAAYYYIRMGEPIRGLIIDRYGDIFSGYFLQLCAKAKGDCIRIGTPIADHVRNEHNLFKDLYHELAGMMIIEDLVDFIEHVHLTETSYIDAYKALSFKIEEFIEECDGFIWQSETKKYFHDICKNMRVWADIVADII